MGQVLEPEGATEEAGPGGKAPEVRPESAAQFLARAGAASPGGKLNSVSSSAATWGSAMPSPLPPPSTLRPAPTAPSPRREGGAGEEMAGADSPSGTAAMLLRRQGWRVGSVVEVFSASLGRWLVALVTQVSTDDTLLTLRFSDGHGRALTKTVARNDVQLAPFGSNLSELPPGFQAVPSQSRPGQVSYLHTASGLRYASQEQAWATHLEGLGCAPVVPGSQK